VPQLAECLRLDLTDALARHLEALAHLLERVLGAVAEHVCRQLGADTRPGIVVSIASAGDLLHGIPTHTFS